jgi:hypothetical protein
MKLKMELFYQLYEKDEIQNDKFRNYISSVTPGMQS